MVENETEKNRSQYDTTFKDLFEQPPQRLLQILIGRQAVDVLPVEFASTQKRFPDLVFLLEDDSIFHLDLQSKPEEMEWRMLMYYSLIRQRYPGKVLVQKVLYVGQAAWHPQAAIEEKNLSFRYEVIDIRSIDCQELMASPTLEENILAILCRMDNQKETIREILHRISELPTKARADALTKLVILSRLRKLETVVKTEAEEMSLTFNVMENDVLRPLFVKERMDGMLEGRQEEAISMLLKQMRRKFGQTPDWVTEKVRSANLELIEMWSDNFVFANSVDEVFVDRH
ncbi:MAG: hypothetical protein HQM03_17535 [Magnetococcales bacterium]|nr:hypothetical protein [Magnetococcales bacterium]